MFLCFLFSEVRKGSTYVRELPVQLVCVSCSHYLPGCKFREFMYLI